MEGVVSTHEHSATFSISLLRKSAVSCHWQNELRHKSKEFFRGLKRYEKKFRQLLWCVALMWTALYKCRAVRWEVQKSRIFPTAM